MSTTQVPTDEAIFAEFEALLAKAKGRRFLLQRMQFILDDVCFGPEYVKARENNELLRSLHDKKAAKLAAEGGAA